MSKENQHFVPKFLLKNFVDTDGRVYCLDIQTDAITKPPPKLAASANRFNDFLIRGQTISFEDRLQTIETKGAPILRRLVKSSSLSDLSKTERKCVADFIATQSFRTEAFRRGLADAADREGVGLIFERLWKSSFLISEEIQGRAWALMQITHDDVFYIGDQPLVLQVTERPDSRDALGLDVKGVEAFLPLNPQIALYMPDRSVSTQIITGYETGMSFHRWIRWSALQGKDLVGFNDAMLHQLQASLSRSHGLYEALTSGVPLVCDPENVANLNYLQCAWAHKNVFSNRRDFTFARRVLDRSPQYRETPRTWLAEVADDFASEC